MKRTLSLVVCDYCCSPFPDMPSWLQLVRTTRRKSVTLPQTFRLLPAEEAQCRR